MSDPADLHSDPASEPSLTRRALWVPSWYELDQSLRSGDVGRFVFFQSQPSWLGNTIASLPPDWLGDFSYVFFNQLLNATPWESRTARILSIQHPILGPLHSVDTYGLDYTFELQSGRSIVVNAEEEPGVCHDEDVSATQWNLMVELTDISQPLDRRDADTAPGAGFPGEGYFDPMI